MLQGHAGHTGFSSGQRESNRNCFPNQRSGAIFKAPDAFHLGTVCAAIQGIPSLHSVANDLAATVRAGRSQNLYGTLETVKGVRLSIHDDLKRLVVFISA